ncbi:hypothetical protein Q1695_014387 [Nippostrongylus brasiliensis]|nr:hypothetical protein Q1695_014387 [Nippostrongylus brasiliensis]
MTTKRMADNETQTPRRPEKQMREDDELEDLENELRRNERVFEEVSSYSRDNPIQERHLGPRNLKEGEQNLKCVYCSLVGDRYRDACARFDRVN